MIKISFKHFILIMMLVVAGCAESGPPSARASCDDLKFSQLSEKIKFLEQYIRFRRTYNELNFCILFQNNSGGLLSGPSDWDIQIVAKIPKSEIELWTKGLLPTTLPNADWVKEVPGSIDISGVSVWFKQDNRLVGVDNTNNVIVYRNTNM